MTGPSGAEPGTQNAASAERDLPALFVTTQTTIPLLTTAMFAFSLGLIGVAAITDWPTVTLPQCSIGTRDVAFPFLALSSFLFLFSTEACVVSHAWDYYQVPQERRDHDRLSKETTYIARCLKHSTAWHARAVWAYRIGFIAATLGLLFLFWPVSIVTSLLAGVWAVASTVFIAYDAILTRQTKRLIRE
jgi:hypothetical protein